ncbi:MAG: trehalose-phosphatase [Candidatus Limnocylindria bacterium]
MRARWHPLHRGRGGRGDVHLLCRVPRHDRPRASGPLTATATTSAARRVLAAAPAALVTDLDGTLSPIAPRPEDAVLAEGAKDALAALRPRLTVVAVISGRAASDARRMLGDPAILLVGNHGAEWLAPHASEPEVEAALAGVPQQLDGLVAALARRLRRHEGLSFEPKGLSATIHYRNVGDPEAARADLLGALGSMGVPRELEVREGRKSVELRPRGVDKGIAVRRIVDRYALRGLLLFGDDRTDIDGFRVARRMREEGRLDAFIGAVGGGPEAVPEVRGAADAVIDSPVELVELLRRIAT